MWPFPICPSILCLPAGVPRLENPGAQGGAHHQLNFVTAVHEEERVNPYPPLPPPQQRLEPLQQECPCHSDSIEPMLKLRPCCSEQIPFTAHSYSMHTHVCCDGRMHGKREGIDDFAVQKQCKGS